MPKGRDTYIIKVSVSQADRQILRPYFPCFVNSIPHFSLPLCFAGENPSQGYRHQLYEQLCAHLYVPQGANHFCGPSDLLSTTTTTSFSELNAYKVWCSSCGESLIQFATHCRPTASIVCRTSTFAEPQSSLPKSDHEHYHDLLKRCIHNFTRQD
jgi:hypothetical protein